MFGSPNICRVFFEYNLFPIIVLMTMNFISSLRAHRIYLV